MDDADRATERIEQTVADGIQRAHLAPQLKPSGHCYYCNEATPTGWLFCCADCRTDWDYMQARNKVNGR